MSCVPTVKRGDLVRPKPEALRHWRFRTRMHRYSHNPAWRPVLRIVRSTQDYPGGGELGCRGCAAPCAYGELRAVGSEVATWLCVNCVEPIDAGVLADAMERYEGEGGR